MFAGLVLGQKLREFRGYQGSKRQQGQGRKPQAPAWTSFWEGKGTVSDDLWFFLPFSTGFGFMTMHVLNFSIELDWIAACLTSPQHSIQGARHHAHSLTGTGSHLLRTAAPSVPLSLSVLLSGSESTQKPRCATAFEGFQKRFVKQIPTPGLVAD